MADRLKQLREEGGLTQKQVAVLAGVNLGTYRNWEQGLRVPRADNIAAIAKALGTTADALIRNVDWSRRKK